MRIFYNENSFREKFKIKQTSNDEYKHVAKECFKKCKPSLICIKHDLQKYVPITKWILQYSLKDDLLKDLFAGVTVGIIQIAPSSFLFSLKK